MGRGAVISSVMTPRNSPPPPPTKLYVAKREGIEIVVYVVYEWMNCTWPNTIHSHTHTYEAEYRAAGGQV
jgi:hypothetical protein